MTHEVVPPLATSEVLTDISGSNWLADLAAQIRAEHNQISTAMQAGFEHAFKAGQLLREAKETIAHGDWLGWISQECGLSARTAQAYMRIAREYPKLDPSKAQRVALLSLRNALRELAGTASALAKIPEERQREALNEAEATDKSTLFVLRRKNRPQDSLAHHPPPPGPRLEDGRAVNVLSKPEHHVYCVAIYPNETGRRMREIIDTIRSDEHAESNEFETLAKEASDEADALKERVKELREESHQMRQLANFVLKKEIEGRHGPAYAFAETHEFHVDAEHERELLKQPSAREAADLLFRWLASGEPGVTLYNCGYWGDMRFMGLASNAISSPQSVSDELRNKLTGAGVGTPGWSGIGSPDQFYALVNGTLGKQDEERPSRTQSQRRSEDSA